MNQRLFAALKPGGHFIVIDHSAKAGADIAVGKTLHRIDEAIVLAECGRRASYLEAESNFLRDPADTREESSGDAKIPTDKFAPSVRQAVANRASVPAGGISRRARGARPFCPAPWHETCLSR